MTSHELVGVLPVNIEQLLLAVALGLLIGVEREWAKKPAGIRTFPLISLLGAMFVIIDIQLLPAVGALLVVGLSILLGGKAFMNNDVNGLSLTTSVSMFVAYGVGLLSASNLYIEAVTVAVLSSLLLVLKRELHQFTSVLTQNELRSAIELAVLAFVIYPLLPTEPFGPWNAIQPRLVWLLIISISGLGFLNYTLVRLFESRGVWVTGFFGGVVSSTAVVTSIAEQSNQDAKMKETAISSIILANVSMVIRNGAIILLFIPQLGLKIAAPLAVIAASGAIVAAEKERRSDHSFESLSLESPFSLRRAVGFGTIFIVILILSAGLNNFIGGESFILTAFVGGFVSSSSVTTTAVTLLDSQTLSPEIAAYGILATTASSIFVKIFIVAYSNRSLLRPLLLWTATATILGTITAIATVQLY